MPSLAGWDGFGLAIQAYQKRAADVIDYVDELARSLNRRDDGAPGQGRLLGHRDQARAGARARRLSGVHPQGDDRSELHRLRATIAGAAAAHLSAIRHPQCADGRDHPRTGGRRSERIRIPAPAWHGRGAVCASCGEDRPDIACRTYAPVGSHRDLLAYLVRRLLENGANSSFVALAADEACRSRSCCGARPTSSAAPTMRAHPNIPLPRDLYRPQREEFARHRIRRARGADAQLRLGRSPRETTCLRREASPMRRREQAECGDRRPARDGLQATGAGRRRETRAATLEKAADLLEQRAAHFIALLQREGGKTLDDALSEVREAVDFCRYYAARGPQAVRRRQGDAGADRREQCAAPARPRRLRRDLAVEFSAGDLSGPGRGGA